MWTVSEPSFSLAEGSYDSAQSVTISCSTAGAAIKYTTDGTDPRTSSTASTYSSALAISSTTTLEAYATKFLMGDSDVMTAVYTFTGSAVVALREAPSAAKLVATATSSGYRLAFGIGPSLPYNTWTPWAASSTDSIWMSFVAAAGTAYSIYWDDSSQGSGYYSADIKVGAYESDKTTRLSDWAADVDSGYATPATITSSTTKLVRLKVTPATVGSFAIRVYEASSSSGDSFAWYKDGDIVSGATSYVYSVDSSALSSGTHRFACVGSRDGATFSESYPVTK